MVHRLHPIVAVIALVAGFAARADAEPAPFMMRAMVDDRLVEGQPLAWTDSQMLLLGRDGALYGFDPAAAKNAKKLGQRFVGYSSEEMVARLRAELGGGFEISTTAHFVVAHPRGEWSAWAERLESLYRSCTHYLGVRGFQVSAPAMPLVAVVFRNQQDYFAHAAASGTQLSSGAMGHYNPDSNRVFLFDIQESGGDADWSANAETIIHEATHQTAYNCGVHQRFAEQPRWVVEGLAMMFEAHGVWGAETHHQQADRLNRDRLDYYRRTAGDRPADWLVRLVESDLAFQIDPLAAYAEAWTLTFYLCETRPQEYSRYLERAAARELFSTYPPQARVKDFTAIFGSDLELLAAQLERFVATLP